ncbi:unknown [Corallococcus sp. CAG:1435]|nr:unknown [Corallococcus sp. CAG:1435]
MLTPCPTDDRKMQLFANFVLVFLKMSGFCNTFLLWFLNFFVFPSIIHLARTKGKQAVVLLRLSLFEVQAFASVKSVANVFYVVGNGLSTFVAVFQIFRISVNNTPCTHKGQTDRCVLETFHCLRRRRLRPSKAWQTFFTSQLIVDNIVVGQKPRYSTPTSSISFILGLEILYFKILPSLSQETTSMSRKIRNWWETVV